MFVSFAMSERDRHKANSRSSANSQICRSLKFAESSRTSSCLREVTPRPLAKRRRIEERIRSLMQPEQADRESMLPEQWQTRQGIAVQILKIPGYLANAPGWRTP